jgi:hypothetical protein
MSISSGKGKQDRKNIYEYNTSKDRQRKEQT